MRKQSRTILFLLAMVLLLAGCWSTAENPEQQPGAEGFVPDATYTPIEEYVDLTNSFSELDDPFEEGEHKSSLTCAELRGEAYMQSDDFVAVQSDTRCMKVFCTWGPQDRMVYIGLKNRETGAFYLLSSAGGSVIGTIDITDVPEGDYHVILCSNDNPSVIAVLHYKIL